MRKISELLRQRYVLKCSYRDIGKSLNISISTVSDYLSCAKVAGISWEDIQKILAGIDRKHRLDVVIMRLLYY